MKITNGEAYGYAQGLSEIVENKEILLPAKINYTIQKNYEKVKSISDLVEKSRENLIRTHGVLNEDETQYEFQKEKN